MTQPTNLQDIQNRCDCQVLAAGKKTQSIAENMKAIACTIAAFAAGLLSLVFLIEFTEELVWVFSSCSLLTLGVIQIIFSAALAYFASEAIQRFRNPSILHNQECVHLHQQELKDNLSIPE